MSNAIVPIDGNAGRVDTATTPAAVAVSKPAFGYGVNPQDVIVSTPAEKPITRLPPAAAQPELQPRSAKWDKVARVGRKAAWGAGAALTAGTGIFAMAATTGVTGTIFAGASVLAAVLAPAALIGALGLAAVGIGKLANRGKAPPPPQPAPVKPRSLWGKMKNFGRKMAKAGTVLTAASLAAGLAAPLVATPLLIGAAAFVGAPVAAAGGLMWALGKLKE